MIDSSWSLLAMDHSAPSAAALSSSRRSLASLAPIRIAQELCFCSLVAPPSLSLSLADTRRRNIPRNIGRARVTRALPECSSRANGALARLTTSLPVFENVDRAGMRTEMRHSQTPSRRARCELEFMTTNSSVTRSASSGALDRDLIEGRARGRLFR